MAACPRSFFLKGLSRKVNFHLCCHSTCIQPSRPHTARSFLPWLSFFFLYICSPGMCAAPGLTSLTGVLSRLLLEATEREGSSGNCRILPDCYLQSPDTAKERRPKVASYIERQGPSLKQVLVQKMTIKTGPVLEDQREPKVEPLYSKTSGQQNHSLLDLEHFSFN